MKKKKGLPKQRNEFAYHLAIRSGSAAGAHQKTKKAIRRKEKVKLQKQDYFDKVA